MFVSAKLYIISHSPKLLTGILGEGEHSSSQEHNFNRDEHSFLSGRNSLSILQCENNNCRHNSLKMSFCEKKKAIKRGFFVERSTKRKKIINFASRKSEREKGK